MQITCYNPATGEYQPVQADSVAGGGAPQQQNPTFGAQRVNLSIFDVHQTIMEGRQQPKPPFNIAGSTGTNSATGNRMPF